MNKGLGLALIATACESSLESLVNTGDLNKAETAQVSTAEEPQTQASHQIPVLEGYYVLESNAKIDLHFKNRTPIVKATNTPVFVHNKRQPENSFILYAGEAELDFFSKIFFGHDSSFAIQYGEESASFATQLGTYLCFGECFNVNPFNIHPNKYVLSGASTIEVLRPTREYDRDILKIVTPFGDTIVAHLKNPSYGSIFIDTNANRGGWVELSQDGLHEIEDHSKTMIAGNVIQVGGNTQAVILENTVIATRANTIFTVNTGDLSFGELYEIAPTGEIFIIDRHSGFNLFEYHTGLLSNVGPTQPLEVEPFAILDDEFNHLRRLVECLHEPLETSLYDEKGYVVGKQTLLYDRGSPNERTLLMPCMGAVTSGLTLTQIYDSQDYNNTNTLYDRSVTREVVYVDRDNNGIADGRTTVTENYSKDEEMPVTVSSETELLQCSPESFVLTAMLHYRVYIDPAILSQIEVSPTLLGELKAQQDFAAGLKQFYDAYQNVTCPTE